MRSVWRKIFWEKVTDKAGMLYEDRAAIWMDCVGQNTENAIKSQHMCWWSSAQGVKYVVKYSGYRKVKGPENTQAVFSLDTQNILKDFTSVK